MGAKMFQFSLPASSIGWLNDENFEHLKLKLCSGSVRHNDFNDFTWTSFCHFRPHILAAKLIAERSSIAFVAVVRAAEVNVAV